MYLFPYLAKSLTFIDYDYETVTKVLLDMVQETNDRLDLFRENMADNLNDYNKVSGDYLHRTIIFIDELAELLKTRDRDKEIQSFYFNYNEPLTYYTELVNVLDSLYVLEENQNEVELDSKPIEEKKKSLKL